MKSYLSLILLFCLNALAAQTSNGWTWLDVDQLGGEFLSDFELPTNDSGIYISTGGDLFFYDGNNFIHYDHTQQGIELDRDYMRRIELVGDSIIWASNAERVMSYHLNNQEWEVFDPNNGEPLTNPNAYDVAVEEDGTVWWAANRSGYEMGDTSWTRKYFRTYGYNMSNGVRSVQIDSANNKWFETAPSICIEGGCSSPPGLAMINTSDTILFDVDSLGFPFLNNLNLKIDQNGVAVAIVSGQTTAHRLEYINGVWTEPTELSLIGSLIDFAFDETNKIYFHTTAGIEFENQDEWSLISIDPNRIHYVYSFQVKNNRVYLGGSSRDESNRSHSALGYYEIGAYFITGSTYWDANANGQRDTLESGLSRILLTTANEELAFSITDGYYSLNLQTAGSTEITATPPLYFLPTSPQNGDTTVVAPDTQGGIDSLDFGFIPDTTATDLRISLTTINNANPGSEVSYSLNIENLAPRATPAQVNFTFDDRLDFISANHPSLAIDNNLLTFVDTLGYQETVRILTTFQVSPEIFTIGDTIFLAGNVTVIDGQTDLNETNNSFEVSQVTTGPFDPNYITVTPAGNGDNGEVPTTTSSLEYTIYFQNIGNDTARNVFITNLIDNDLELASLTVVSSSHNHHFELLNSRGGIRWIFPEIDLVDSLTNDVGSIGYVTYRIAPLNRAEGTQITNQADIFFDFNEPIRTNRTLTTLTDPVINSVTSEQVVNNGCLENFYVKNDQLIVEFPDLFTGQMDVFTVSGQRLLSRSLREKTPITSLDKLPAGFYVAKLTGRGCSTSFIFWNY